MLGNIRNSNFGTLANQWRPGTLNRTKYSAYWVLKLKLAVKNPPHNLSPWVTKDSSWVLSPWVTSRRKKVLFITLLLYMSDTFTESVKAKIKRIGGGLFEDAEAEEACLSKSGIMGLIFFFLYIIFNSYPAIALICFGHLVLNRNEPKWKNCPSQI